MDEGADTINYLAISDAVVPTSSLNTQSKEEGKERTESHDEAEVSNPYNGKFFFDREVVSPYLTGTRTHTSQEEQEKLWELCLKMTEEKNQD